MPELKLKAQKPKLQATYGSAQKGGWFSESARHRNARVLGEAGSVYAEDKRKQEKKANAKKKIGAILGKLKEKAIGAEKKIAEKIREARLPKEEQEQLKAIEKGEVKGVKEEPKEKKDLIKKGISLGATALKIAAEAIKSQNTKYVEDKLETINNRIEQIDDQIREQEEEGAVSEELVKFKDDLFKEKDKVESHLEKLRERDEKIRQAKEEAIALAKETGREVIETGREFGGEVIEFGKKGITEEIKEEKGILSEAFEEPTLEEDYLGGETMPEDLPLIDWKEMEKEKTPLEEMQEEIGLKEEEDGTPLGLLEKEIQKEFAQEEKGYSQEGFEKEALAEAYKGEGFMPLISPKKKRKPTEIEEETEEE